LSSGKPWCATGDRLSHNPASGPVARPEQPLYSARAVERGMGNAVTREKWLDPSNWASLKPFGIGEQHPNNYLEL